jgi:hypothetical protein
LAAAMPAFAAENIGGFVDMRLGYSQLGGDFDVKVSPPAGASVESEESFDTTHRLDLNWVGCLGMRAYGGVLWGIGGSYGFNETEPIAGQTIDVQTWAVKGHIGYGVPFTDYFQLEALPFIGVGRSHLHSTGSHFSEAPYTEYGIDFNAVFTLPNGFQFGATAGMFWYDTSVLDETNVTRYHIHTDDVKFGAFIGVRL